MGISRIYMNRLAILTVLVALSVGMTVAANGVTHIQQNVVKCRIRNDQQGLNHWRQFHWNGSPT